MTAADPVSAAKIAVYILLAPPALYALVKHASLSFLGWLNIFVFCILRFVTGCYGLHGDRTGETYLILNSIGLSPLMIGLASIQQEARRATNPHLNKRLELILEIVFNALVSIGMILMIVSLVHMFEGEVKSSDKTLLDLGQIMTVVAYLFVFGWIIFSLLKLSTVSRYNDPEATKNGKILLYACLAAMPIIGMRVAYSVIYLQLMMHKPRSSPLASTAFQVCLSVLPEMLCVAVMLPAGILTRNLKQIIQRRDANIQESQETGMLMTKQ